MPGARPCHSKKIADKAQPRSNDRSRAAAIGILIAWQELADGGRVRMWRPISFGFHLSHSSTERLNDQVQARVYLARWIYADTEPARQDADQGIQRLPDAGAASAVGF